MGTPGSQNANDICKYVIDASVAVKLFFPEELTECARALFARLDEPNVLFLVPDLFFAECGNVFWKKISRQNLPRELVVEYMEDLCKLDLARIGLYEVVPKALRIAIAYSISVYDAVYVATAEYVQAPLITADERLVAKMADADETILWVGDLPQE